MLVHPPSHPAPGAHVAMVDDGAIETIIAMLRAGDAALAERRCRRELEHQPNAPKFLFLLACALRQQGQAHTALEVFARLVELCPHDATHWGNYAAALEAVDDFTAAVNAAETAVRCAPDALQPLHQLGLLYLQQGRPAAAREVLLRARAVAPDAADVCLHAAQACVACRDALAGELLRPWRTWLPLADAQQRLLADLLTQTGETQDAVGLLEELVSRDPADWPSALLLAKVYERVNRPDAARAALERITAHAPAQDAAIAHEVKAQQAQLAMRARDYAQARALLERAGAWGADDDGHFFALAKACDRLGDAAATMRALATAHALQVNDLRASNPDLLQAGAPWLLHADARVEPASYAAWPRLRAPDASQSPVFVVGFPRSGTTLLEQMLDAHPCLQSMDERPFFNQLAAQLQDAGVEVPGNLERLNQRDCDELRKGYVVLACGKVTRSWDTRLVDKNPLNLLWLPLLQRMFPHAQIILALRHPCDVILSCYLQNFRAAPLVAACRSLEHLAHAYVAAMASWLYHAELFQPDVFVSRYEDLVADPASQVDRIAEFLGLDGAAAMLHFATRARAKGFIRTPSYSRVTEPVDARATGRWQSYRAWFEPILPILQPMLDHWHYSARPGVAPRTPNHEHQ